MVLNIVLIYAPSPSSQLKQFTIRFERAPRARFVRQTEVVTAGDDEA
jgi:hypothetical protein